MRTPVLLSVTLGLTAAAAAQIPHLVGITSTTPALVHRDHAGCALLAQCTPAGFPSAPPAFPTFGGTGWDPVQRGAWISNGPVLAVVDDTCGYLCPPAPVPTPAPITGLEVLESLNEVWATDGAGNICRLSRACPPTLLGVCNTGLPTGGQQGLAGLAVDEGRQLVFYCHTDFATGVSGIFVSPLANPCQPFFAIHPPNVCTVLTGITGLAVDWGNSTLYLTDGRTTAAWPYVAGPGPSIAFGTLTCCTLPMGADRYIGLAWQPQPAQPFGAPCANGTCAPCPMVHTTNGDPNLGNGFFALDLTGAPAGSLVWCLVGIGTCVAPGVFVPPLCGPVYVGGSATGTVSSLGPNLVGGIGCAGATSFPLPLPPAPGLAGLPLASQCVALCPAGAGGTSLSNCLSFELQGN
jgi:hypothetical protein